MESMEFGLPVVAWEISGCNELILDRTNGSLLNFGDIAGAADAVESVLSDRDLWHRYSIGANERFKQHDISEYTPRLMRIYRDATTARQVADRQERLADK